MARLFVAVDLPPSARSEAARAIDAMRPAVPDARWVPVQNLHITLAFLGATSLVTQVREAVSSAAQGLAPFELSLDGTGCFPSERHARVVWIGLGGSTPALEAAAAAVWERLTPLGFEPEKRPFAAHLTVARLRMPEPVSLPAVSLNTEPFPVQSLILLESHLGRPAARYEPVVVAPLGK